MDIENTDTTTARVLESTATFDKASLLLGQKNNTVHFCTVYFFTPATPYFPRQLPAKYHRHHGA